jgi:hypothetical protein
VVGGGTTSPVGETDPGTGAGLNGVSVGPGTGDVVAVVPGWVITGTVSVTVPDRRKMNVTRR